MHSFVLVHIGNEFFGYINDCIEQIRNFNECDIYLAAGIEHKSKIRDKKIIFVPINSMHVNKKHDIFNQTTLLE